MFALLNKRGIRFGIASILTMNMVLIVGLLMTTITVLDIRRERNISHDELEKQGLLLVNTLNHSLSDPLYYSDVDKLRDIAEVVRDQPDVRSVRVFTPNGRLLVIDSKTPDPSDYATGFIQSDLAMSSLHRRGTVVRFTDDTLKIASPITVGRELLEGIELALHTSHLSTEIHGIIWEHVWQGVALTSIGMALSWLLAQYFVRPLRKLLGATKEMAEGNFEFSSGRRRNDEIGDLSTAFEKMSHQLGTSTAHLKEANEWLLVEVFERTQAEERIRAALEEKEVLLREIHHRVKNNLQVISSLLNLQSPRIKDPQAVEVLRESQNRVRAMALVHQKLYSSHDLGMIDFADYSRSLVSVLLSSYGNSTQHVALKTNVDDIPLDINMAIPCGLIINELVSNSLKHAFSVKKEGELGIELHSTSDTQISLTVSDDGDGFPEDLDFRATESLGLQLVNGLTKQLNGTIELDRSQGTAFKLTFPGPTGQPTGQEEG